jgi:signal transduction histidine kinase
MKQNRTGQFGWVVLLLATAVILPTVCLLWFMTQAVRNERLAVRQKLVDLYQKKAEEAVSGMPSPVFDEKQLAAVIGGRTAGIGEPMVVFSANGQMLYPTYEKIAIPSPESSSELARAWKLEFVDANSLAAAAAYEEIAAHTSDPTTLYEARLGQARCLAQAQGGNVGKANQILWTLADRGSQEGIPLFPPEQLMRGIVRVWDSPVYTGGLPPGLQLCKMMSRLNTNDQFAGCATEVHAWALQRLLGSSWLSKWKEDSLKAQIQASQTIFEAELASLDAATKYDTLESVKLLPLDRMARLNTSAAIYGRHIENNGIHVLCITTRDRLREQQLADVLTRVNDMIVSGRILDDKQLLVAGDPNVTTEAFVKASMGKWMPQWRMELYFRDTVVFENAAKKQAALYTWTAILVIALILAATATAGVSVNRQMKVNRLKNDFIATVTHELKTPLSSMRVLVDTLLAGDCRDEKQEKEYLELIARENLRLSRLIDNFLTFSRMERNKKAFDIQPCEPAKIVADAAEAVKTKFGSNKCAFESSVSDGLPLVMADHDSAVTVLVNLLDNACKYSDSDKQISLKVFAEDGEVCFAVKDNGYGMTKRVMKRIFERFYQADQSLARSAEGCGLGLSIVKFIVETHKGKITVESTPGKGSCFTVRLPAAAQDRS